MTTLLSEAARRMGKAKSWKKTEAARKNGRLSPGLGGRRRSYPPCPNAPASRKSESHQFVKSKCVNCKLLQPEPAQFPPGPKTRIRDNEERKRIDRQWADMG